MSETTRIVYGKSSLLGTTGTSARSARAPWPMSRRLGPRMKPASPTEKGITALQMDIKITGVTFDILRDALSQARDARLSILAQMKDAISEPRTELSPHAPRILTVKIDPEKIGLLIGKGGETIRGLTEAVSYTHLTLPTTPYV